MRPTGAMLATFDACADQFAEALAGHGRLSPGAGGAGLPRLDTSRLRATWLADCAQLLGLPAFLRAAGITCSQRLGDIIAGLQPGDEAETVALLGASTR